MNRVSLLRRVAFLLPIYLMAATIVVLAASSQQPTPGIARATRVDHAPKLDGTLDDPLWQSAAPLTDFRQQEPYEGQPATERTEVRILYTHSEIFFGIACYDSQSGAIVATQLRRDGSQELDDYFEIVIDSNRNRRNAYLFQVNPLGTQRDGLITDEQQSEDSVGDGDSAWDGIWVSEARIGPQGWTATISIPFATLNFLQTGQVNWGINFKRFIRRKNERDLWSAWRRTYGASKISQAGEVQGISEIGSGRLFIIKPYGLLGFEHWPQSAAADGLNPGTDALYTGGVDVKIGLRSNLVANLTANTDFADADVDPQQFNLTPYKLFYPEKRQFFLENAGIFNFSLGGENDRLFFSRQIGVDPNTGQQVPINGGAKITGSLAGFDVGLLDVDTRSSGPNPYANFAVARIKRSLFSGSYIGFMGIDKRSNFPAEPYNQTGGVDARFVLPYDFVVNGFAVQSRTPGFSAGQYDFGGGIQFRSNWFEFLGDHRKIGPNFNPQAGFIERSDCICDYIDGVIRYRPKLPGVRELNFEGFLFHAPDTHGVLQTQEVQGTFRAQLHNGALLDTDIIDKNIQLLTEPFNLYKNVFLPVSLYSWDRHQIFLSSPQDRRFIFSLFERFGTYYNGHLNELRLRENYRRSERLSFSLATQWDRFRLPVTGGDFSILLASLETDYAFSRFLFLSTVIQANSSNAQAVSSNIRLRWNYRPDSDLFVIYTIGPQFANLAETNPVAINQQRFAIKFTYSFLR
jgi:hypothetical protein